MNLPNPFRRPSVPTYTSIVDVGRDSIKALIAQAHEGQVRIMGYGLSEAHGRDITGGRVEAEAVQQAVDAALTQAEDLTEQSVGYKIVPDEVIFIVPSQATIGQLFIVDLARSQPREPISAKELSRLKRQAQQLAQTEMNRTLSEETHWQFLTLVEADFQIDGHAVISPVGRTGQKISWAWFGITVETSVYRALHALADSLNLKIKHILSPAQLLTAGRSLREAVLLEVGATGTAFYLVRHNLVTATSWLPLGGDFFSQSLAQAANISPHVAKTLKHELSTRQLSPQETAWVNINLDQARTHWYEAVMEVLAELSPEQPLPRYIHLTGGGSRLAGLAKLLRIDPIPFDCAPEVGLLTLSPKVQLDEQMADIPIDLFAVALGGALIWPTL